MTALLADLRVVDLTADRGGLAGRLLGELGAEVVRVEARTEAQGAGPRPRAEDGTSLHELHRHAGKLVVTLDPSEQDDRSALDGLLAGADVVVVAGAWGEGSDQLPAGALAAAHPHLVVVSVTPFGLDGPAAGWSGPELVAQAMAGVVYRSGVPELPPVSAPGSFCEDVGAVTAVLAALVALRQAGVDGSGQLVDVAEVLALAQCTDMALPLWSLLHADQARSGAGLYPLFECTDGLARIVLPMAPADWRSLIVWLGSPPEWTGPEWEAPMLAPEQRDQVVARLPERFAERTRDELALEGEAAGIRITPVLTPAEVLANEHTAARGTFTPVEVGGGRTGSLFAGFFGVDGERAAVRGPAERGERPPDWRPRPGGVPGPRSMALPLDGIRVLEVGTGVAAPEAGRVLAEWGAEVIKVESRRRPDFQRRVLGGDMNPAFSTPNRVKLGLAADLSNPEGRDLVRRLLPSIDVVVENNATGVIDRLGLGWDVLRRENPRLVMVGSQLYGDRGPWAERKGYGPSARAVGGLTWLWAHGADAPRGVQTIHPDHLAGRLCAIGALAGLRARDRTGRGCRVDVAQFEAVVALLGDLLLGESLAPGSALPTGNRSPEHAPWDLHRCRDDQEGAEAWLAVCVADDEAWSRLLEVAAGAVPDEPGWRDEAGRLADRERVEDAVAAWLAQEDAAEMEGRLQAAGVAAGQALHPRLQATHPHFVARGYPVPVDQPGSGPLLLEGPAFVGSLMGRPRCGPAPMPGQHTAQVCRELLGLDDDGIARLVASGAIDPLEE